jgi:AraC family transcriptional regulator, transcriptional activator of pobA
MDTAAIAPTFLTEWHCASGNTSKLKDKPFEIYQLENVQYTNPILTDSSYRRNRYEIIWVKTGNGAIKAEGQVYTVHDNMLYCISPGKTYTYLEGNSILNGYYISFSPDFIQAWQGYEMKGAIEFFGETFTLQFIPVPENIQHELETIADKMKQEYNNCFNHKPELLRGLLNIFIIYFSRTALQENDANVFTRDNVLFKQFISLVKKNFVSKKMVSDYADELCVTANYLNRTVKKVSGNTASYHIQQQIIMEAKKQAVHCGSSMKEIAYQLGFDNLAHFSKFFKNNSGTNFTCFRKGMQYTE